jgi:hypothetical protein
MIAICMKTDQQVVGARYGVSKVEESEHDTEYNTPG